MPTLSRIAQVLRYILQVAPGIGHTKLAKFAYLADLEALKYLGRPVTRFSYVVDLYGPFDKIGFFAARDELLAEQLITESQEQCGDYLGYVMAPIGALEYDFTVVEAEVLSYVAKTYFAMRARDLCDDVVYKTEPMQDAKPGKALPMSAVARRDGHKHGFSLERMLAGEASAKAGRVTPFAKVLNGLRARHN
jgi:hypothetical protein